MNQARPMVAPSSDVQADAARTPPSLIEQSRAVGVDQTNAGQSSRQSRRADVGACLQDEERELAIKQAGLELERAQAAYEASNGCFSAAAARDSARDRMYELIRGRSPEQVARMEAERGFA